MSAFLFLIPLGLAVVSTGMAFIDEENYYSIPTKMVEENLLKQVLKGYSSAVLENKESLAQHLEDGVIYFRKNEKIGNFEAVFSKEIPQEEAINLISSLNDEYSSLIQEIVYKTVIDNLGENNLSLESEEVLDDDSIVLTLNVNE